MAKRFTETGKWEDVWFHKLNNDQRMFWMFLLDKCDNAGVWEKNFEVASFFVGKHVTEEWALSFVGEKVVQLNGSKWFIPKFVDFQYGKLSKANRAHASVIDKLTQYGLDPDKIKEHPRGIQGAKDKDKEQDKDKEKDKDKDTPTEAVIEESAYVSSVELSEGRFNPKVTEIQRKWNTFAKKHGLSTVEVIHPIRMQWILLRLKEAHFDFDKILTGIEKKGWGLGKDGYRIDFDKIVRDGAYYITLIEANSIQTEETKKAEVLYSTCEYCGSKLKRTHMTGHVLICPKNPNLKPLARSA